MTKKNRLVSTTRGLLVIAFALLLTDRLSAGDDEAKAEKTIKAFNGSVIRDAKAKGKPIIEVG